MSVKVINAGLDATSKVIQKTLAKKTGQTTIPKAISSAVDMFLSNKQAQKQYLKYFPKNEKVCVQFLTAGPDKNGRIFNFAHDLLFDSLKKGVPEERAKIGIDLLKKVTGTEYIKIAKESAKVFEQFLLNK